LTQERLKIAKIESEHSATIETLKAKNKRDFEAIESSQKSTLAMLIQEKEKTVEAH
jgi:hypothetical protein